jgi:hypothetical protein
MSEHNNKVLKVNEDGTYSATAIQWVKNCGLKGVSSRVFKLFAFYLTNWNFCFLTLSV